jgi:transposase
MTIQDVARHLKVGWDLIKEIRGAAATGIKVLQQMSKTLAMHRTGLLAYYDIMISIGPMEKTYNKIKTMKRQAYGFRDIEFFKLKILAISTRPSRHW